jgi:hypothetical protein
MNDVFYIGNNVLKKSLDKGYTFIFVFPHVLAIARSRLRERMLQAVFYYNED